jgi:haloacetate dehalogenase
MFEGFIRTEIVTSGARIHLRHGGDGPPLLLLHGNPLTHVSWHKVAGRLAERFHVVAADLRGYGDSVGPEDGGENHINYSFRAMAQDQVEVMEQLGYREFFAAGHDRGARTVHRMCLDHPERVRRAAVIDILPNYHIWTHASKNWAMKSWHWLFMAQPYDLPEHDGRSAGAVVHGKEIVEAGHRARLFRSRGLRRICPLFHVEDDPRLL